MPDSVKKKNPHTALLVGLDGAVENELSTVLRADGWQVATQPGARADIVFCGHQKPVYQTAVEQYAKLPVVVVSRLPEVSDWLDALEAGAADYCAAPFEPSQLRWLLNNHVPGPQRPRRSVAAA
jgi:CheY-like chemotaxis protein